MKWLSTSKVAISESVTDLAVTRLSSPHPSSQSISCVPCSLLALLAKHNHSELSILITSFLPSTSHTQSDAGPQHSAPCKPYLPDHPNCVLGGSQRERFSRSSNFNCTAISSICQYHCEHNTHTCNLTPPYTDMPRKVAFSAKKKRAQLKQKRAVKRGDVEPPPTKPDRRRKLDKASAAHSLDPSRKAATESSRRLQSSFVKLPRSFLEETKHLAATLPLERPVPPAAAVLEVEAALTSPVPQQGSSSEEKSRRLACPRRPKWRYDMSKKEVEQNEEGLFKKWLDQTDGMIDDWCDASAHKISSQEQPEEIASANAVPTSMPHAPASFERNLEVWRQL